MTTEEAKRKSVRHRSAARMGAVAGLILLALYLGYEYGMTPPTPDIQKAAASEVVAYIADPRGLGRQPQVEQQRFLERWRDLITEDAAKREELKAHFENMDDLVRKDFSAEMYKHLKRSFLDDARMYATMAPDARFAFLRERIMQYRERAVFLKDVAVGFGKQFTGTEDDMREWIMRNTTAEERAVGEPFAEALKKADEQMRKEQRVIPSTPAPTSAQGASAPS